MGCLPGVRESLECAGEPPTWASAPPHCPRPGPVPGGATPPGMTYSPLPTCHLLPLFRSVRQVPQMVQALHLWLCRHCMDASPHTSFACSIESQIFNDRPCSARIWEGRRARRCLAARPASAPSWSGRAQEMNRAGWEHWTGQLYPARSFQKSSVILIQFPEQQTSYV